MRQIISFILFLLVTFCSLRAQTSQFASGADISWCTEMEAEGRKFYNHADEETDIFVLMKQIGMNAIRLRVWVDPSGYGYGPWCDKADVVAKARRAHQQGLDLLIDFHYSDTFADPATQNIPHEWEGLSREELRTAMENHTKDVLQALKDEGITPRWVQVGNETNSGILMMFGQIHWDKYGTERFSDYVYYNNAGYDAVKEVCPEAQVIVHLGGTENAQWFFKDFMAAGGKVDMIGLSHYPTEDQWNSSSADATHSNINAEKYVKQAIADFGVPVMICETGFDVSRPALAQEVMIDLFNRLTQIDQCAGIFYWEPEVDGVWKPSYYDTLGWGAYGMGAFTTDGKPTKALDAFGGKTTPDGDYPSDLKIYDKMGQTVLQTLLPESGQDGLYSGQLNATEPWMNFQVVDIESNTWYGTDPADKTKVSAEAGHWNFWIDSDKTGIYDIQIDLVNMRWSHTYNEHASSDIYYIEMPHESSLVFDIYGRPVSTFHHGVYLLRLNNHFITVVK